MKTFTGDGISQSPVLAGERIPRIHYTGKELDEETGLYYYGARYLNPRTSMWISADPAMGEYVPVAPNDDEAKKYNENLPGMGGIFNYVNFHVYHYAGNNPVKYVDPDGRDGEHYASGSERISPPPGSPLEERPDLTLPLVLGLAAHFIKELTGENQEDTFNIYGPDRNNSNDRIGIEIGTDLTVGNKTAKVFAKGSASANNVDYDIAGMQLGADINVNFTGGARFTFRQAGTIEAAVISIDFSASGTVIGGKGFWLTNPKLTPYRRQFFSLKYTIPLR